MQFVDGPIEWPPEPPSFDEVSKAFGGRVFAFAPQRHLDRAGVNVERTNGEISAIAVHYSVYVNPDDLDDPANFRRLKDGEIPQPELVPGRPPWVRDWILRSRYPLLWEAVRTSTTAEALLWGSVPAALAQHLDGIAANALDRGPNSFLIPDPDATDPGLAEAFTLEIDGSSHPGIRIENRGYRAYAATLGGRVLSVVLPDDLPIEPELRFVSK